MAVIRITPGDLLAGKTLEKGTYTAILSEIEGPKASASQKSVSFFLTFQLTKAPFAGKELKCALNTETNSVSLLGDLKWFPCNETFPKILAAVRGIQFSSLPLETMDLDTDELLNKPLDLMVGVETVNGSLINVINGWLPAGSATASVPF